MTPFPDTLQERQLIYALHPLRQWHPSWQARMGQALDLPPAWLEAESLPPALAQRLYRHFRLAPDLPDFSSLARRTLLLMWAEASQLLLRLGLVIWWPAFQRAIDGRMRRRLAEALGSDGEAVIVRALERAQGLQHAFGLPRPWASEMRLYQSGYLAWCAALNHAPDSAAARRLRFCLPAGWRLKQSAPPPRPIPAAPDLVQWLAAESFPQCSWLKH